MKNAIWFGAGVLVTLVVVTLIAAVMMSPGLGSEPRVDLAATATVKAGMAVVAPTATGSPDQAAVQPVAVEATATSLPVPTAAPARSGDVPTVSSDLDQTLDLGGVQFTLRGAGLLDWATAKANDPEVAQMEAFEAFQGATSMGKLAVTITNTTGANVSLHPGQGTVVIGPEQIELGRFMFFSDRVGGDYFPGVTKSGDVVFALTGTPWDRVAGGVDLLYVVGGPSNADSFDRLAEGDYEFRARLEP